MTSRHPRTIETSASLATKVPVRSFDWSEMWVGKLEESIVGSDAVRLCRRGLGLAVRVGVEREIRHHGSFEVRVGKFVILSRKPLHLIVLRLVAGSWVKGEGCHC